MTNKGCLYWNMLPLNKQKCHNLSLSLAADTFDPNLPEEGPSAPPPGWLDSVTGYEEHTGGGEKLSCEPIIYKDRIKTITTRNKDKN